eukprot:CAMPEP_0180163702 /NCGR_PEP_ID=MMETSP0986-20121125/29950_1 /TAXON_ID=697907 /ORGANISM="non described non described, Strain CCMP2293" /LENGTH=79 /DNA_ID=CAMNT_0022114375 /DNA_START=263 /DNA_END=503 /DNA_ORIENTATION=-
MAPHRSRTPLDVNTSQSASSLGAVGDLAEEDAEEAERVALPEEEIRGHEHHRPEVVELHEKVVWQVPRDVHRVEDDVAE